MRPLIFLAALLAPIASAEVPETLSYQGIVTDDAGVRLPDGDYDFTFRLYDVESGGSPLWEEEQLLLVRNGIFNAFLGRVVPLDLTFDVPYWLGVSVSGENELAPRTPLATSAYSFNARSVEVGAITSEAIAAATVVRALNGLQESVRLVGGGGVTVVSEGDSIRIAVDVDASGDSWRLSGNSNAAPDSAFVGTTDDQPLEIRVAGERAMRFEPTHPSEGPNVIGGSHVNSVGAGVVGATIGGGGDALDAGSSNPNAVTGRFGTVGGGAANTAGHDATVGGGFRNSATATQSVVAGGFDNLASGSASAVAGGSGNEAGGTWSAVAGGRGNSTTGSRSYIGGGENNTVAESDAAVLFGSDCQVLAIGAIAMGRQVSIANAHPGATLLADSTPQTFESALPNEFAVRATGGVRLVTAVDNQGTPVSGVELPAGGSAWQTLSDRNAKADVDPVDPGDILQKVLAMPIATWSYRTQPGVRHIGPMAQDFHGRLGVGTDERHIATVDADGAALAAIQGLHAELLARDALIAALEGRVRALEARADGGAR